MAQLVPLLYGASFVLLLVQAFRVMARGFKAVPRLGDPTGITLASSGDSEGFPGGSGGADRTGRLTVHPELLDSHGQLIRDDLMTVRFSGENEESTVPPEAT